MEVPRLGVESDRSCSHWPAPELLAYTTATATWDVSHVFDLHHSSRHHQILNPLSEAMNQTYILLDPNQVQNPQSHNGNSLNKILINGSAFSIICFILQSHGAIHCVLVKASINIIYVFSFFFFFFWHFRAEPAAYGGSQARGGIRTTATRLHQSHSNSGSQPRLQPTPQFLATPDP